MRVALRSLIVSMLLLGILHISVSTEDYCDSNSYNLDTANQYFSEGNIIRAISITSCIIDQHNGEAETYLLRAFAYFNLDYFEMALLDLGEAISLDETVSEAYATRAYIHQFMGNYELAKNDYLMSIDLWSPESNVVLQTVNLRYGITLAQLQDFDGSISVYNTLIDTNPNYALPYLHRAMTYNSLDQSTRFEDDIQQALSLDPTVVRQYLSEVYLYTQAGNYPMAHTIARNSIMISPSDFQAYFEEGYIYFSEGLFEEAIQEFDSAIELNNNMLRAYQFRGLAYHYLGETDLAFQNIELALDILPTMYTAYNARALIYQELDETDLAITDYLESISIFPNQLDPYLKLGNLYFINSDLDNALVYYNQYVTRAELLAEQEVLERITIINNMIDD